MLVPRILPPLAPLVGYLVVAAFPPGHALRVRAAQPARQHHQPGFYECADAMVCGCYRTGGAGGPERRVPLRITAGEVAFGDASLLVRGLVCVV